MATLRTLEAQFLRWFQETSTERDWLDEKQRFVWRDADGSKRFWSVEPTRDRFMPVDTLAEAHGIRFLCPQSFAKNGGPVGTHTVYIWFAGSPVPPHIGRNSAGEMVRWNVVGGTGYDDLQLSPSILEQGLDGWHGWVGSSGVAPGHAA